VKRVFADYAYGWEAGLGQRDHVEPLKELLIGALGTVERKSVESIDAMIPWKRAEPN
jgi:hypothetical protein